MNHNIDVSFRSTISDEQHQSEYWCYIILYFFPKMEIYLIPSRILLLPLIKTFFPSFELITLKTKKNDVLFCYKWYAMAFDLCIFIRNLINNFLLLVDYSYSQ